MNTLYLIIFIFIKLLTLTCCKIYYIFIQFFEYNVNYIIVFFLSSSYVKIYMYF